MAFATRRDGKMNRYNLHVEHPESEAMDCDSDGEWVRYADIKDCLMTDKEPVADVLCNVGLSALNKMWQEQCSMCCKLPCTDTICRQDMDSEGGCHGAMFADIFMQIIRGR
jgi:hypothetical protein